MPAAKDLKVKLTLPSAEAKLFTSMGPLLDGSVVELPRAEAEGYCERGIAIPVLKDLAEDLREPICDVEAAANNQNPRGSFRASHRRQLVDLTNAQVRSA